MIIVLWPHNDSPLEKLHILETKSLIDLYFKSRGTQETLITRTSICAEEDTGIHLK